MEHRKLEGLMSPMEKVARVATGGLRAASAQTSPSGAISLDNADGTRTIIGEVSNGESNPSYTMATHVGDTTPPGIPTGITATSKSGVVVVEWDGTLSGGIPDDFFCVRIFLDNVELGALSEAGSVASAKLQSGTTVSVTATSEDDCCLPDGTPAHNVSDATQAISVTVAKDASEVMADVDEQIEGVEQEIADFKANTYTKAETDKKVQDLDDEISTELTTNYYNKSQIDTTYATKTLVSQTKEEIELSASQTYATKGIGNPNLGPFFAHDLADVYDATINPDGYWKLVGTNPNGSALPGCSTQLIGDGWAHVAKAASSANMVYAIMPDDGIEVGMTYTVLFEFANAQLGDNFRFQVANASVYGQLGPSETYIVPINGVEHLRLTYTAVQANELIRFNFQAASVGELDIRVSLFEGEYDGPFKPYVTDQTSLAKEYSTKSELIVGLGGIKGQAVQTYEEAIKPIVIGGRNLITLAETVNGYVNANTGAIGSPSANQERTSGLIPVTPGETYICQNWCEVTSSQQAWSRISWYASDKSYIGGDATFGTAGVGYAILKAVAPANAAYARASWRTFGNGRGKLEQATTPTDYTAAPEDLMARPNLTPFGSHPLDDVYDATTNPDGYWAIRPNAAYVTQLADGWLHFERTNTGTGVVASNMATMPMPDVGEDELLTMLMEVRNNQSTAPTSGNPNSIYVQQANGAQLWGNTVQSSDLTNDSAARIWLMGESFEKRLTKVTDSDHKTGDYVRGFFINVQCGIGQTLSFDFRVSVYRGGYGGGYVPYSIEDTTLSKTYTRSAYFEQTATGFDERITATEDGLAVQETLIRQYSGGVLVAYKGNSTGALVNAAGQYDIVSLTWTDGEPTIIRTLATSSDAGYSIFDEDGNPIAEFGPNGVSLLGAHVMLGTDMEQAYTFWAQGNPIGLIGNVRTQSGEAYSGVIVNPYGSNDSVEIIGRTLGIVKFLGLADGMPAWTGAEYDMAHVMAAFDLGHYVGRMDSSNFSSIPSFETSAARCFGVAYSSTDHYYKVVSGTSVGSGTTQTINFGVEFAGISSVVVSGGDDVGISGTVTPVADSYTATTFEAKKLGGSTGNWRVNWIAIGWVAA